MLTSCAPPLPPHQYYFLKFGFLRTRQNFNSSIIYEFCKNAAIAFKYAFSTKKKKEFYS